VGKLKSLDLSSKKSLIESKLTKLSMMRQCELIGFNRSSLYYNKKPISKEDKEIMQKIEKIYSEISIYGYRRIHKKLKEEGYNIGHNKVHKLMKIMGLEGIRPKRKIRNIKKYLNKIYPYLLKDIEITKSNQIWSSDITYIPVKGGFIYLCAIVDWYSRAVIAYNISNTMDINLVTQTLSEALNKYPKPEIFNTDQGSQYTSKEVY